MATYCSIVSQLSHHNVLFATSTSKFCSPKPSLTRRCCFQYGWFSWIQYIAVRRNAKCRISCLLDRRWRLKRSRRSTQRFYATARHVSLVWRLRSCFVFSNATRENSCSSDTNSRSKRLTRWIACDGLIIDASSTRTCWHQYFCFQLNLLCYRRWPFEVDQDGLITKAEFENKM